MALQDLTNPLPYFRFINLLEARVAFRLQCRMLDITEDMKRKWVGNLSCQAGSTKTMPITRKMVATQEHLRDCSAYTDLRQEGDVDNNWKDRVNYFKEVMNRRNKGGQAGNITIP